MWENEGKIDVVMFVFYSKSIKLDIEIFLWKVGE